MNWKSKILDIATRIDDKVDTIQATLKQRLGANEPVHIVPYRTYGTSRKIYVRGRVLEDKKIATAHEADSLFTNILNMYKRFESDEVAGAKVKIVLPDEQHEVVTNKEGHFVFDLVPKTEIHSQHLYHTIELQLLHPAATGNKNAIAEIMIPPADAEYGIISDIDDTVIKTGATSLLAMGKTVLLSNARTRLPYAGVSEFYKALQLGRNGKRNNPFFYVSSSPWNLYDLLVDYLDHNQIPAGPLLLRDFGLNESFINSDYLSHKLKEITQILETYPLLNFVLVGDSGEHDPPIYYEVVKRFPGRILAIYIRDVASGAKQKIAKDVALSLKDLQVEMILSEHSVEAAKHAAATGLIFTSKLPEIEQDKKEDEGEAGGKQELEAV